MDEGKGTPVPEGEPKRPAGSYGWSVAKRIIRIVVGVVLIILGFIALVTPCTPGSWLALLGLELLGLRVLLRDKSRTWAAAKPDSRLRRAIAQALGWDGLDAIKEKWRRRGAKPQG